MKTNVQQMKDDMIRKFGKFAIGQSVWLHTRRTSDLEELTPIELESLYNQFFPQPVHADPVVEMYQEQHLKSLRSIILKDAQYIGLYDVQNWDPFNAFMREKSPFKKALNKYTADEFEPLIKQFKSLRSKYDKAAKTPGTKEWYHKNRLPLPSKN